MASLQEQLLKAGLTSKQKSRQANSDKRKKNKQKRSGVQHEDSLQDQVKKDLIKAQSEKQEKDNALNELKKQQLAAKEENLRIKQILTHHQLNKVDGDNFYNYTFENKIKKLSLDNKTHNALINGRLSICGLDGETYIVTRETAEKLSTLNPDVILVQNDKVGDEQLDEDDPYADFQIPDDLMW
jgi:uncharacterized protein YaiL (DUF2058 family)